MDLGTAQANLSQGRGTALGNLAVGQATQGQNLSANTSSALGQYAMQGGQGRANAYEGMASSLNSGIQNGLTSYMMMQQQQRPNAYGNNYGTIGGQRYNGPR
jgi:hypothetical protein